MIPIEIRVKSFIQLAKSSNNLTAGDLIEITSSRENGLLTCVGYICQVSLERRTIPPYLEDQIRAFSISPTFPVIEDPIVRVMLLSPRRGVLQIGNYNDYPIISYKLLKKKSIENFDAFQLKKYKELYDKHRIYQNRG